MVLQLAIVAAISCWDYPVGGSRETGMKTAHGLTNRKRERAWDQARFVSDMGDPDFQEICDGWRQ